MVSFLGQGSALPNCTVKHLINHQVLQIKYQCIKITRVGKQVEFYCIFYYIYFKLHRKTYLLFVFNFIAPSLVLELAHSLKQTYLPFVKCWPEDSMEEVRIQNTQA